MPKITVFVPAYNVEDYIERCLDSIVNQTMQDFEIIVVNDGSPDHSEEVILNYQKKEPRLRYFYQENQGLGEARNKGIREAKGKYICFIDSDDYIEPTYLEDLYDAILKEKAEIAYCGMRRVTKENKILEEFMQSEDELWSFEQPSACNKLYKTSLFSDYHIYFPAKTLYEDLGTIPKLLMVSKKNVQVPKILYNYFVNEGSITQTYNKRVLEMRKILKSLDDFVVEQKLDQYFVNLEYVNLYAGIINTSFRMIVSGLFTNQEIKEVVREFEAKYPHCYENEIAKRRFPLKYRVICFLVRHRLFHTYRLFVTVRRKFSHG